MLPSEDLLQWLHFCFCNSWRRSSDQNVPAVCTASSHSIHLRKCSNVLYSITECRLKSIHIPCQNNANSHSCYSVQHTFGCMVCFVLLVGVEIPTEEVEGSGCRNRQSTWTPAEQICTTAIWNQRDHGFIWGWEGGGGGPFPHCVCGSLAHYSDASTTLFYSEAH